MCINQAVSLNTFLVGLFSTGLALGNGVLSFPSALYYLSFISMQLVEFFTWRNLSNPTFNRNMSILGLSLVLLQQVFIIWANLPNGSLHQKYILGLYFLFIAFILGFGISYYQIEFKMTKAPNGHLAWHWLKFPLWIFLVWASFLLYAILINHEYVKAAVWCVVIGYIYIKYSPTSTWGTIWCWIINVLSLVLLYRVFKKSIGPECT